MFISSKYRTHEEKITLQLMKVYLENDYIYVLLKQADGKCLVQRKL